MEPVYPTDPKTKVGGEGENRAKAGEWWSEWTACKKKKGLEPERERVAGFAGHDHRPKKRLEESKKAR